MRYNIVLFLLAGGALVSAISLIQLRYDNHRLFQQLQQQEKTHAQLEVEWGQLQLEQSVWARPARIEKIAKEQLQMFIPAP
ncbi:cell division protein FtsL [Candidatus Venteria ishoeyi]|uniref:Cell division protein FtsL n=1 Tax=Candidatus Venteria ishoeyi TaxID=1899563 RepID=A0A1H6F249_9GAMM|nr:cell division protein FtsL [Candidatus Venteria ishoeyi]MDM8548181.1 cell division protein FtsL [Candidatus Venteria ishoeyi]SEH04227.1 cell division protein FtsL [Candidatus Venteria ishoeyi]SEH04233.1 cell division protein FtsL [Candidatus Venteria ishoeyi]